MSFTSVYEVGTTKGHCRFSTPKKSDIMDSVTNAKVVIPSCTVVVQLCVILYYRCVIVGSYSRMFDNNMLFYAFQLCVNIVMQFLIVEHFDADTGYRDRKVQRGAQIVNIVTETSCF